ncbi:MAG: MarR family winged helix-turn-helix transcriptional regulator [Tissierellia bacterium]|nr:MarR family winged helix-turn-helix transcriptional regulator [Tissierellia bacterium]
MDLRHSLNNFYYSTALCDLRLMNAKYLSENITYNSLLYLELIYCMDGKCTASQIADLLYISKPAVSLKINELIKQGLVNKKVNPKDNRQNLLSLNNDKVPQYKIYKHQDSLAVKRIEEKFSKEDIEKFCEMLDIITEINYEEIND